MGQTVPVPENETERLMAVRSILPFGIEATPELSALSELGQSVFSTTRAAVHIVDEDWLHIACQAGMPFSDCSRDISICTKVITTQKTLIVPDLSVHSELKDLPYVKAGPCLRFYAGVPIELDAGLVVGTFCIVDTQPRQLSPNEIESLQRFAVLAAALLRLQRANFTMSLAEQDLKTAAMTDPLTGFFNRKALDHLVTLQLNAALRDDQFFGALYLDMDGFKAINDTLGHSAGDTVLQEAAIRIRETVRAEDVVIRVGGDEFAIFIPRPVGPEKLGELADRLLVAFREPFDADGEHLVHARLSIGGAIAPEAGRDLGTLLRTVDKALYQAKAEGRDRFVCRTN
ncbi:diguanylate cyclase (GGDEF)-like protein [Rhizobium sp. BIGb0125]|jgi:diguanylate cyclase (GGDEF)-like protein|uniref:sensor domain-containing diguanylate cyclase n=1 Tax=Rhizobium sp. BIGb0125 TaxID=2940618 RepID=UPI0021698E6D|nr:sensor domain-containing diguanylate cyclase [Rhizobium sp. BIGb0125]MCS4241666.1 diguanylate cyclase (GGDEF)-like protein [Rhizobium sp. BIGb0125]